MFFCVLQNTSFILVLLWLYISCSHSNTLIFLDRLTCSGMYLIKQPFPTRGILVHFLFFMRWMKEASFSRLSWLQDVASSCCCRSFSCDPSTSLPRAGAVVESNSAVSLVCSLEPELVGRSPFHFLSLANCFCWGALGAFRHVVVFV